MLSRLAFANKILEKLLTLSLCLNKKGYGKEAARGFPFK